jgi:hypothetical protein
LFALAVDALPAPHHRPNHGILTKLQSIVNAGANLVNSSNNFVARNRRRHNVLLSVSKDALVGATHGTAQNPQDNFPRPRLGLRDFLDSHIAYPVENCCLHIFSLSFPGTLGRLGAKLPLTLS